MPRQTTYSEELQDIMGRIPGWVIRWGVTMIFLIFLSVVGLSFFVRYPEVIEAPIVLTTMNPPADLIAKSTGKIESFLVKDSDPVYKESVIAVLFNTADYRDILSLEKQLKTYGENWDDYTGEVFTGQHNISAGELQSYLSQFVKACKSYKHYLDAAYIPKKIALLRNQINIQKLNYENQKSQIGLLGQEMELEKISLGRDSVMYSIQAITMSDYQRSQQNMMQKQSALIGQRSSIALTESNILANEGQLVELNIQYENEITNMILQLTESRAQLLSQINLWKDRYIITSPLTEPEKTWLKENTFGIYPEISNEVGAYIGDARIVGIGEITHGSGSIKGARAQIIKYLIEKKGFTIITNESTSDFIFEPINKYISLPVADRNQTAADFNAPDGMADLIEWLAIFNRKTGGKVRFMGTENSDIRGVIIQINRYLSGELSAQLDTLRRIILTASKSQDQDNFYASKPLNFSPEQIKEVFDALEVCRQWTLNNIPEAKDRDLIMHNIELVERYMDLSDVKREKIMADNIEWIANRYPDEKIIFLAHNLHVGYGMRGYIEGRAGYQLNKNSGRIIIR